MTRLNRAALQFVTLIFAVFLIDACEAQKALVIGNNHYPNLAREQQLEKAVNDAADVGNALRSLGFEVTSGLNLSRQAMLETLSRFVESISEGDNLVVYYAGHGVAVAGANYLIPTDVPILNLNSETLLRGIAIAESDVLSELQSKKPQSIVLILDACRDNPFPRVSGRSLGAGRGLAETKPARGVFTIYSAGIGQSALDRLSSTDQDRNSVFTRIFLQELVSADKHLAELAISIRERVAALALEAKDSSGGASPHEQTPAYYDQTLGGRIYLSPRLTSRDASQPPIGPTQPQAEQLVSISPMVKPDIAKSPALLRDRESFKECPTCPEMIIVPAGEFEMGSTDEEHRVADNREQRLYKQEGPKQRITIRRFAVGKYALTFEEWDACVTDGGCAGYKPLDGVVGVYYPNWGGRGRRPVIHVSFEDAKGYVNWLNSKTDGGYRLLSEAEHEYVTRAGTKTVFWWGNSINSRQANYHGNERFRDGPVGQWRMNLMPVDSFEPNPWGLYQVHGNVREMVEDCWKENLQGIPVDGTPRTSNGNCSKIVVRGGSWVRAPIYLRASARDDREVTSRAADIGFRVAKTLGK